MFGAGSTATFEWLTNEIGVRWVMDAVGSEIEQSVPRSAIVAGDGAAALDDAAFGPSTDIGC